ncbi:hypothetical protein Gpo141_00010578 [Globisporangium polare]
MAAFVVSSSDPTRNGDGYQTLQREWTLTSAHQLQTLHVKVPGIVFIDYDPSLSPVTGTALPLPKGRAVAKIVVTTDSSRLLELLEVVPLYEDKETKGFRFHVKNQSADFHCSVLTQIYVSDKCVLRDLLSNGADLVLGDDVVVRDDEKAELNLVALHSGDIFLSSTKGFSLRSFAARKTGGGEFQIHVPSLEATEKLVLSAGGPSTTGAMTVFASKMSAKTILSLAGQSHSVAVETHDLATEILMIWSMQGGSATFTGQGVATRYVGILVGNGVIDTAAITAENAAVSILWAGKAVTRATKELRAVAKWSGSIQYAGERPEVVKESSRFRWKWLNGDLVTPLTPSPSSLKPQPHKPRELPPREPKAVHVRMKKTYFGKEPMLNSGCRALFRLSSLTLLSGAAVLVAVGVVVAKRRQ